MTRPSLVLLSTASCLHGVLVVVELRVTGDLALPAALQAATAQLVTQKVAEVDCAAVEADEVRHAVIEAAVVDAEPHEVGLAAKDQLKAVLRLAVIRNQLHRAASLECDSDVFMRVGCFDHHTSFALAPGDGLFLPFYNVIMARWTILCEINVSIPLWSGGKLERDFGTAITAGARKSDNNLGWAFAHSNCILYGG